MFFFFFLNHHTRLYHRWLNSKRRDGHREAVSLQQTGDLSREMLALAQWRFWLEGALLLMHASRAWAEQTNSPSWLAWRSQGGTCCHEAWGCHCPRKQEGGAAADASPPGGKEDEEGCSVSSFTVGAASGSVVSGGTMFAKLPHAMQMVDAACWQRTL